MDTSFNEDTKERLLDTLTGPHFVISRDGLKFLKRDDKRSYASSDDSWLSIYVFQPYWRLVAEMLPDWMSPNVVTLAGLFFQFVAYGLTFLFCGNGFVTELPRWMHIVNALGIFLYQTMDAVDGNQARRLGAGSKIGEFLDNFIDIPAVMMGVFCLLVGLGIDGLGLYYVVLSLILNHFAILWETNHRRVMNFGIGSNSVTEGQVMMTLIHISLAIWGLQGSIWTKLIFGYEVRHLLVFILAGIFNGLPVLQAAFRVLEKDAQWGQTRFQAIVQQVPCIILFICSEIYVRTSPNNVLYSHTRLFISILMLIEIQVLGNMVLVRQCDEKFSWFQISLAPYVLLLVNNFLPTPFIGEILGLKLYFAFLLFLTIRYAVSTIYQMCYWLDLYFVKINKKKSN